MAWALCLLGGCSTWRMGVPLEARTRAGDTKRLLVFTKARAIELDVTHADEARVDGLLVAEWSMPATFSDKLLRDLRSSTASPSSLAEEHEWELQLGRARHHRITIPRRDILFVRVYEARLGRALGVTGMTLLFVLAAVLGALGGVAVGGGRPLRVRGRVVRTKTLRAPERTAWSAPLTVAPVPEAVRRVLAEAWEREARAEHAAIAAFSKLALELMALGAPPDLIRRANVAAIQEVEHARLCFALASAYAGQPLEPAPLPEALAGDTADLTRLARETFADGCLAEALAAEVARLGATQAHDPAVARVLRLLAREEAQHADLAWRIVDWALADAGEPLRAALLAELDRLPLPKGCELPEHGRVGRDAVRTAHAQVRAAARARLLARPALREAA